MRAQLIACLTEVPEPGRLAALAGEAQWLEVRADLVGELPVERLRAEFGGGLLYTLRSRAEGGSSEAGDVERAARLAAAAASYDLVDLEGRTDLRGEILAAVPAARRLISWHGGPAGVGELRQRLAALSVAEARWFKLVPRAEASHQALAPLELLAGLERRDVVAFAAGGEGSWSRLLAPRLGAPLVYAALGEPAADGQLSLAELIGDYGLPELGPAVALFGIVGGAASRSLSPRLHNGCYRRLGLPCLYLPFPVASFGDFWLEVVESGRLEEAGFRLRGLSVTAPHKEVAMAVAGAVSPLADHVGSANTLVRRGGVWEAESTDARGVLAPLAARRLDPRGWRAAVVGAGGAGRVVAFALAQAGADVTVVNRDAGRGRRAAQLAGVGFEPLAGFDPAGRRLVVNATPLGASDDDPLPFDPEALPEDGVVVDLVYRRAAATPLVRRAERAGRTAIDGREVLLEQAVEQFRIQTGHELPVAEARRLLALEPRQGER